MEISKQEWEMLFPPPHPPSPGHPNHENKYIIK